jgi:hypothetical protein
MTSSMGSDSTIIRALLAKFGELYGMRFTQTWEGFTSDQLQRVWSEELTGYTLDELRVGMSRVKANLGDFPPGIGEFQRHCRPWLRHDFGLRTAVEQLRLRKTGEDTWPHPALYWAAVKLGEHTMTSTPHERLIGPWADAFDAAYASECEAVPPALPPPAPTEGTSGRLTPAAKKALREISRILSSPSEAAKKGYQAGWIHVGGAHGYGSNHGS